MSTIGRRTQLSQMRALRSAVESELRHIPNLRSVGIGMCERSGLLTGEIGFRIHVTHKRHEIDVPRRYRIPKQIFGFPTDVHPVRSASQECCGGQRPLLAGLGIQVEAPFAGGDGTLGCFLDVGGMPTMLTNQHVVPQPGKRLADRLSLKVHQPRVKAGCNLVGNTVPSQVFMGNHPVDDVDYYVDLAVVEHREELDFLNQFVATKAYGTEGSTEVDIPDGVVGSVKTNSEGQVVEIRDGSNVVDTTKIMGSGLAEVGTLVWKVGSATGLTVGVVESTEEDLFLAQFGDTARNLIIVRPLAGFFNNDLNVLSFSEQTDSGSVYVNLQNQVVGLHHSGLSSLDAGVEKNGAGSHIDAVLDRIGNGAKVWTGNGSAGLANAAESTLNTMALWANTPREALDFDNLERDLRTRLSCTAKGAELLTFVDEHLPEILRLVWQRRPVTVAWHRHHGPAFVVMFIRALATPGKDFPLSASGTTRRALLVEMAEVLAVHGSSSLRQGLSSIRPWLLDLLCECRDLDHFCHQLERMVA